MSVFIYLPGSWARRYKDLSTLMSGSFLISQGPREPTIMQAAVMSFWQCTVHISCYSSPSFGWCTPERLSISSLTAWMLEFWMYGGKSKRSIRLLYLPNSIPYACSALGNLCYCGTFIFYILRTPTEVKSRKYLYSSGIGVSFHGVYVCLYYSMIFMLQAHVLSHSAPISADLLLCGFAGPNWGWRCDHILWCWVAD